ncbi:uncharacterized protein LOC117326382 isoform X11 [Pecten maximus]|uniref:uncharacterized protein LOC117326382 isoform X11 n=1 Tax=Pecten maximus TaxID=6579 RepID=UPI001458D4B6|nr:uncharacterized protein LOC117326382 isoform X11 [Pecten maximus]
MKNMNNRKRVSFGSKGSMVETWIIEDFQEPETDGQIYRNLVNKSSECRYTQSNACALKHRFGVRIHSGFRRSPELSVTDSNLEAPYMILESRDNPFVPGSDLCKEAEEILQKATIIRDRFILSDETGDTPDGEVTSETKSQPNFPGNGKDCSVVEEELSPQTSAPVNTAPNAKARQNGKIDDTVSPTAVKVEVGGGQSDGLTVIGDAKDKKKQKKCCSVM